MTQEIKYWKDNLEQTYAGSFIVPPDDLDKIVAEAERRGRMAALQEMKSLEVPLESFCSDPKYREACNDFIAAINAKLTELKKV